MSDERLDIIQATLDGHTNTLDRHTATLGVHTKTLDKLEINVDVLKDDVKLIAEGHAATQAAIARATRTIVAHIDHRFGLLEQAFKEHLKSHQAGRRT